MLLRLLAPATLPFHIVLSFIFDCRVSFVEGAYLPNPSIVAERATRRSNLARRAHIILPRSETGSTSSHHSRHSDSPDPPKHGSALHGQDKSPENRINLKSGHIQVMNDLGTGPKSVPGLPGETTGEKFRILTSDRGHMMQNPWGVIDEKQYLDDYITWHNTNEGKGGEAFNRLRAFWRTMMAKRDLYWQDVKEHERILEQCKQLGKEGNVIAKAEFAVQKKKWELELAELQIKKLVSRWGKDHGRRSLTETRLGQGLVAAAAIAAPITAAGSVAAAVVSANNTRGSSRAALDSARAAQAAANNTRLPPGPSKLRRRSRSRKHVLWKALH